MRRCAGSPAANCVMIASALAPRILCASKPAKWRRLQRSGEPPDKPLHLELYDWALSHPCSFLRGNHTSRCPIHRADCQRLGVAHDQRQVIDELEERSKR
jgi:hypothetical protein